MIPHLFGKELIPTITHPELLSAIETVRHARDVQHAVEVALSIITKKYRGYRFHTYILFWKSFEKDPNKLWKREGFLHCTQMNYLLRVLLIQSGWVEESDISLGYSLVWFVSIHQYLIVSIDGKRLALDPWNYHFGCMLGSYASGFGYKKL